jgi:hypothetical protein
MKAQSGMFYLRKTLLLPAGGLFLSLWGRDTKIKKNNDQGQYTRIKTKGMEQDWHKRPRPWNKTGMDQRQTKLKFDLIKSLLHNELNCYNFQRQCSFFNDSLFLQWCTCNLSLFALLVVVYTRNCNLSLWASSLLSRRTAEPLAVALLGTRAQGTPTYGVVHPQQISPHTACYQIPSYSQDHS